VKITFLGTSSAVPTRTRNVSALGLQFDQRSEWWLLDCGEGTQHQVMRSTFTLARLRRIFLSHLHGDHCFGLMGLLATRGLQSGTGPVDIHGPVGLKDYVQSIRRTTGTSFQYPVQILEHEKTGTIFEDDEYTVTAVQVPHAGLTFAYVIDEKPQAGRFRVEEAERLGIAPGPVFARLKRGEPVTLDDGRVVEGATLVDPPRAGRRIALVSDTTDASAIVPFAQDADFLLHEATYLARTDAEAARTHRHATAEIAGALAARIGAKRLALTHFSPRYESDEPGAPRVADLVAEARTAFGSEAVVAAADFMTIEIPRRDKRPETP
jgi:ribonuclease Z